MKSSKVVSTIALFLLVIFLTAPAFTQVNIIVNPDFESGVPVEGNPSGYGFWSGDFVSAFVSAENGITPISGSRMLHFIYTAKILIQTLLLENYGAEYRH